MALHSPGNPQHLHLSAFFSFNFLVLESFSGNISFSVFFHHVFLPWLLSLCTQMCKWIFQSGSDWKYSSYINYFKSLRVMLKFGHTSGLGISTSVGYSLRACPKLHVLKGGLASSKLALQIPCIFPNLVFLSLEPTSFTIHGVKANWLFLFTSLLFLFIGCFPLVSL